MLRTPLPDEDRRRCQMRIVVDSCDDHVAVIGKELTGFFSELTGYFQT